MRPVTGQGCPDHPKHQHYQESAGQLLRVSALVHCMPQLAFLEHHAVFFDTILFCVLSQRIANEVHIFAHSSSHHSI